MAWRKAKRDLTTEEQLARGPVDLPFLTLVVLLTGVGLLMLLSASYPSAYYNLEKGIDTGGNPYYYFNRQLGFAVLGFVAMWFAAKVDYQRYRWLSVFALVGSVILLILIFSPLGREYNGARRWLKLGIQFQPSEFAKIGVIMYFSARLSKRKSKLKEPKKWNKRRLFGRIGAFLDHIGFLELIPYGVILAIVLGLIGMQSHMSCMVLIAISSVAVLYAAGIHWLWFIAGLGGGSGLLYLIMTKTDYMAARLENWRNPEANAQGGNSQIIQSKIAIGSGGLLGQGLGNGKQKFLFLPEEHNDFIFAVVCEELGLIGACVIILLFALLIIRGYWLAIHARDRFGTLLIVGITTLLAAQVILNIGVVTGVLPTTGISLPFFSYGGTALAIQLAEMGIILGVSRQIPAARAG